MELAKNLRTFIWKIKMTSVKNFSSKVNSGNYCMDSVKKYDYENFLCTLLLPDNIRSKAFALRAYNIELARVQDNVSDPLIGEMRLQFWSDTIDNLYDGKVAEHPVAQQLHKTLNSNNLSKRNLKRLITSRVKFLKKQHFNSLEEMEKYAEESVSPIYYLLLEASGIKNVQADHAASHLGKAIGITTLLRSQPYLTNNKQKFITLPQDILVKHGISEESVLRIQRNKSKILHDVVYDVASRAWQHLFKARNIKVKQREVKTIFLPAVAISNYLERLRQSHFDLFNSRVMNRDYFLPIRIYWHKFRSTY